ncbi:MAG TPA: sugar kinase [Abditibacteriaceae bacterium]
MNPTIDVVTFGEAMALFAPLGEKNLAHAPLLTKSVAGAESNLAIALSRLGKKVRWISRVGNDPFGDIILKAVGGEGVDISLVERDETTPSGIFFRQIHAHFGPQVFYFRTHSAASKMGVHDVNEAWFAGARHLHVTGITPALSDSCREATFEALKIARDKGLSISFDPNLRRKLWSEEQARHTLLEMLPLCDLFLPGHEECEFLFGPGTTQEWMSKALSMGPQLVVMKRAEKGALAATKDGLIEAPSFAIEKVIDPIGAGDAFAAGFLSAWLDALPIPQCLSRANILGALATQFQGDWEGLPTLQEVQQIEAGQSGISR